MIGRIGCWRVQRLVGAGLVKQRGRVRTDSTHVLAAVRKLNRVELVGETLRVALEELAAADAHWLAALIAPEWARRYGRPVRYDRLPRGKDDLAAHVLQIGRDGMTVLEAVYAAGAPRRLRDLPGVQVLRQVWVQQYWTDSRGDLAWRAAKSSRDRQSRHGRPRRSSGEESDEKPDPARVPWSGIEIVSPHDPEARYCRKEGKTTTKAEWVGYRDHQSETCDDSVPIVIVHVLTRPAPVQDIDAVDDIHAGLAASGLKPVEHLVDSGYVTPDVIHHTAQQWSIALIGPVRADPRGRPGFTKEDFHVNWDDHTVTCPRGVTSPPSNPPSATASPVCRCCSLARPAGPAPTAPPAPATPAARAATSPCCPSRCSRSRPATAPSSTPNLGRPATPCAPAARPPSPKPPAPTAYATAATKASPKPTSNTS